MASIILCPRFNLLRGYFVSDNLVDSPFRGSSKNRWQNGLQFKEAKDFQAFLHNGYILHLFHANCWILTQSKYFER